MRYRFTALLVIISMFPMGIGVVASDHRLAVAPGNEYFLRTWERTDRPVVDGLISRTWMWGPEAISEVLVEDYVEGTVDDELLGLSTGQRAVQYFDKARMEITDPAADPASIWYVTNGLLVVEMISGQQQVGHTAFIPRSPADVPVAGDADDVNGPTYATFGMLLNVPAAGLGDSVTARVDRSGTVVDDPAVGALGVTIGQVDDVTNHAIAGPFWDFMNSSGPIWENGQATTGPLFQNPYFATGRPITEPYGALVKVAGTVQLVIIQCFERRCLTYTPQNAPEWQVEAGNVGLHYSDWLDDDDEPAPLGDWGDAPAGDLAENVDAYPGVVARFPTYSKHRDSVIDPNHPRGMWVDEATTFWLGSEPPDLSNDSTQDPGQPDNDSFPLFIYAGEGNNPISCALVPITTSEDYDATSTSVYINVFVDQNRDGQWKEGRDGTATLNAWNGERVVADIEVSQFLKAGDLNVFMFSGLRLQDPESDHWVRVTVTSEPLGEIIDGPDSDALMHDATQTEPVSPNYGEIEDHLLTNCAGLSALPDMACAIPYAEVLPSPPWKRDWCAVELVTSGTRVIGTPRPPNWVDFGPWVIVHKFGAGCNEDTTFANFGLYGFERIDGEGAPPTVRKGPNAGPLDPGVAAAAPLPAAVKGYPMVEDAGISIASIKANGVMGGVVGKDDRIIALWQAQYPNPGRDRIDRAWVAVRYIGSSGATIPIVGLAGDDLNLIPSAEPVADFGTYLSEDFTETPVETPELSKTASVAVVQPGEYITYSITVPANPELEEATEGSIVDPILAEFFDSNAELALEELTCNIGECFYDDSENNVVWTGTLAPGDVVEMSFMIMVPDDLLSVEYPESYVNCIQGFDGVEEFFDICATTTVQLPDEPELEKTADVAVVQPGEYITYSITMPANPGLEEASEGVIVDPVLAEFFDSNAELALAELTCNIGECFYDDSENNIVWMGLLQPGAVVEMSFMLMVPDDLLPIEYPEVYENCIQGFDGVQDFSGVCASTTVQLPPEE